MTRDKRNDGASSNETTGFNGKPITIELDGRAIDAVHHFTGPGDRLLHLHIDERAGGIDVTVPLCSDKPAYARSDAGRRALGIDTDDQQQERELVADGGIDVRDGAIVRTCKHEACDEPAAMNGTYGRYCGQECLNAVVATDEALSRCGHLDCMHATRGEYCSTACAREMQLARECAAGANIERWTGSDNDLESIRGVAQRLSGGDE